MVKKYKISKNKKKAKSNQEETSDLNREKDQDITADSKNIGKLEERIAKEHYARQFEQEELKINYGGVINEDHEEDDSFEQGNYIYIYIYIYRRPGRVHGKKYIRRHRSTRTLCRVN